MKRFVSWNVNGVRAVLGKGLVDIIKQLDADIFCMQETKMQQGQAVVDVPGYHQYWNYAERKGYSGTAVFTREEPLSVSMGIGVPEGDSEGRTITLEFDGYYFITVYTPNAKEDLSRLAFRVEWEKAFREYVCTLSEKKPVVFCGDLNVAHKEIDLKNPKPNRGKAGFTDEERGEMTKLLDAGFTDTFRYFYPELEGAYSWWSYRYNARANNAGWRIDYFIVSDALVPRLVSACIHPEIFGSDHCPVELVIE
ncbi:MAG: exodeoxyribonuclease III [Clostridiales bacterium]|nr:exodeoxyribonuclease III [Clostridiales bacterium]